MEQRENQKPTYRMSSAGRCPRALSAQRLGYEPAPEPKFLAQAAEEGKWHEQRIVDELRADDIAVTAQQMEVTLEYPSFILVGHIDGIINDHSDEAQLLEIKSMSQFEFDRWMKGNFKVFRQYAVQLTCYMEATELNRALYIVKNRSSGYEDRKTIEGTPVPMDEVSQTLTGVEASVANKALIDATFDPQDIECRRCLYQHLCITVPEFTELDETMLNLAVDTWRKGKALADEGKALIDEARLTLSSYAKGLDTRKFIHNQLAVQLLKQHRESYIKGKLEELFTVKQLAPALKVQDVEQLRVTDMQKGED